MQENKFDLNKQIAENINHYMSLRGRTRKELSRELGVAYTTVCSWCNGNKTPRTKNLANLCKYLNCCQADILIYTQETPNTDYTNTDDLFLKEYKRLTEVQKTLLLNLAKEFRKM